MRAGSLEIFLYSWQNMSVKDLKVQGLITSRSKCTSGHQGLITYLLKCTLGHLTECIKDKRYGLITYIWKRIWCHFKI